MYILSVHYTFQALIILALLSMILSTYVFILTPISLRKLSFAWRTAAKLFFLCLGLCLAYALVYGLSFGAINLEVLTIHFPWIVKNIFIFPFFAGIFSLGLLLGLVYIKDKSFILKLIALALLAIILFVTAGIAMQWRNDMDLLRYKSQYYLLAAHATDNTQLYNLYQRASVSYDGDVRDLNLINTIAENKNIAPVFLRIIFEDAASAEKYYKYYLFNSLAKNPATPADILNKILLALPNYKSLNIGQNPYQTLADNPNTPADDLVLLYNKIENLPLADESYLALKNVYYSLILNPHASARLLSLIYPKIAQPAVTYYDVLFAQNKNTPPEIMAALSKKVLTRFSLVLNDRQKYSQERGMFVMIIRALLGNPTTSLLDKTALSQLPAI